MFKCYPEAIVEMLIVFWLG